jgi:hypothetical protein
MDSSLLKKYEHAVRQYDGNCQDASLLIAANGALAVYYAPFEFVNDKARLVLVGITPGATQASNALVEARRQLESGADAATVLRRAKQTGAFSGAMRSNLIALLDHIGLPKWLGIDSCAALFGSGAGLVQTASVLTYPTFVGGCNYSGTPDSMATPFLRDMVLAHFVPMTRVLRDAAYVPLGPVPSRVLNSLARDGIVASGRILDGLPHPSGANAERIAYFLGRKPRHGLSSKTDPNRLDEARAILLRTVATL